VELIEFIKTLDLDWGNMQVDWDAGTSLDFEMGTDPEEFLWFAQRDLEQGGKHGLVNALSNAKRAIDCQVEKTQRCLGIPKKRRFSDRLSILQDLGIVAPRIVKKVIEKRNYLEHEYKCPEQDEVEDAVDIATLFLEANNRLLEEFPDRFYLYSGTLNERNITLFFDFDSEKRHFILNAPKGTERMETIVTADSTENYLSILRLAVATFRGLDTREPIEQFLKSAGI
jgi:hypothetical protein